MKSFEVAYTENWTETLLDYQIGKNHQEIFDTLCIDGKRIYNERFREIEKTGKYFRITECSKGGKSFIYEIN
jgi:hypothetical protein